MVKRSFQHKLRHAAAIVVGAMGSNVSSLKTWRKGSWAIHTWFFPPSEEVSDSVYQRRLLTCEDCPIFFRRWGLRTCGSPLDREMPEAGCFCQMDELARDKYATCWLRERDLGGWSKEINGDGQ